MSNMNKKSKTLENDIDISSYLYIVKAVAIVSVVSAHTSPVPDNTGTFNFLCSRILNSLGTMGVPVFFLLAGFFFEKNTRKWKEFWKNKLVTIIVPWICCATILWLYVVIRKGGIEFESWFWFVYGRTSTMYHLKVLVELYIILFFLKQYKWFLYIFIGLSGASILLSGWSENILNVWFGNVYCNLFNWIGYFGIGILIQRRKLLIKLVYWAERLVGIWILLYVMTSWLHYSQGWSWTYWSKFALLNIFLQCAICFGIASVLMRTKRFSKCLIEVGKNSFSIYLTHQLIVGVIVYITNIVEIGIVTLARPFITIILWNIGMGGAIYVVKRYFPRMKKCFMVLGLR